MIRKEEDGKVKAFIHVYKTWNMNGMTSILFRDYLNNHEDERKRYQELKIELYSTKLLVPRNGTNVEEC